MKRNILFCLLEILSLLWCACADPKLDPNKPVYVTIETTMGDVTVRLYDETPLHRDNFIRLCQSGEYEGVLFHRVIQDFVAQGGDLTSKAHEPGALYGEDGGGYTIPAEILPQYFNKRGALIDAKESDDVNPERASAGTQFCFVQGRVYKDEEFAERENRLNEIRRKWLYYRFRDRLQKENPELADPAREDELHIEASILLEDTLAELGPIVIPEERREVYRTIGGVPHLDGSVTIFGEVVEGLDVVERMTQVKTDAHDRPLQDILIKSTKVFQK